MKRTNHSQPIFRQFFLISFSFILSANLLQAQSSRAVTFSSKDSVTVTADLYIEHSNDVPFIIFFHQAGWSRGEYLEIAPKVNRLGFNAMAVDQRSGGKVNDVTNQTKLDAEKLGKDTKYHDAIPDMVAAIKYINKRYSKAKIIIWGSSYSSSLALKLAGDYPDLVNGVLAFSPAEYFGRFGKGDDFVSKSAKNIKCPVFITSAKSEAERWKPIFDIIPSKKKQSFIPEDSGHHGSRALWKKKKGYKKYWVVVEAFLNKNF